MHPRLAAPLARADSTRAALLAYLESLSHAEYVAPGRDGGWSASQHGAHLHLVEASSVRALFRAFRTARTNGLAAETETTPLDGGLVPGDLVRLSRKLTAPEFVTPTDAPDLASLRDRLAESRVGLHSWAAEADGYALATVHFPHPLLGSLNLYEWIAMIDGHEQRHLRQMRGETGGTA